MDTKDLYKIIQNLSSAPSNPVEIEYMISTWQSINQFSQNMLNATNKYKKTIQSHEHKSISSSNISNSNNLSIKNSKQLQLTEMFQYSKK